MLNSMKNMKFNLIDLYIYVYFIEFTGLDWIYKKRYSV